MSTRSRPDSRPTGVLLPETDYWRVPVHFDGNDIVGPVDMVSHCADLRLFDRWLEFLLKVRYWKHRPIVESVPGPAVHYGLGIPWVRQENQAGLVPALGGLDVDASGTIYVIVLSHWDCGRVKDELGKARAGEPDLTEEKLQYRYLERIARELSGVLHHRTGLSVFVITGIEPTGYDLGKEITPGHIGYAGPSFHH